MKARRELLILEHMFLVSVCGAAGFVAPAAEAQVAPAPEQSPTVKTGKAAIVGVVVDSLHGGYLAGADVLVGARTIARTDSLGRFTVDSLSPGLYQVGIFHPVLDTLGIALGTKPFNLAADSASVVILSVPSAATLVAQSCTPSPNSHGNSAVIGQVIDPETLRPVPGADVSLAWVDFEVAKRNRIKTTPRVVRDSTDNFGRFSLCGLPSAMEANLQAKRGNTETAQVTITLGESPTALFARTLLLSALDSGLTSGNAVVAGRVVLEGSAPTAGTRVEMAGTSAVTITDEKGQFTLRNLPSGTHVLIARHLGYAATAVSVDLSSRESKAVSITLPKAMNIMEPVLVLARRTAALERFGFERRRRFAGGGYHFGPEEIDRIRPSKLTDVLRLAPGLVVRRGLYGNDVVTSLRKSIVWGGCFYYYVDNVRWNSLEPGDINWYVSGRELVAVEVYPGFVPVEYAGGPENCGAIVIWTNMRIRD